MELEAAEMASRQRMLGSIRFIGELYKLKVTRYNENILYLAHFPEVNVLFPCFIGLVHCIVSGFSWNHSLLRFYSFIKGNRGAKGVALALRIIIVSIDTV